MNKMSFSDWLTLLFIGLKLTHQIDWAWWWVVSPILIVIAFGAIVNKINNLLKKYAQRGLQEKT
jgi:hypothetical protein